MSLDSILFIPLLRCDGFSLTLPVRFRESPPQSEYFAGSCDAFFPMMSYHEIFGFMNPALSQEILEWSYTGEKPVYKATLKAVADFKKLRKDTASLAGWRHNRVARTFLVFFLSSLGAASGTYIAGFRIIHQLFH